MTNLRRLAPFFFLGLVFLVGVFLPKEKQPDAASHVKQTTQASESSRLSVADTQKVATAAIEKVKLPEITTSIKAVPATVVTKGVVITDQGDNLLVLINKHIRLPENYQPADLVPIDGKIAVTRSGMRLRNEAASALAQMAATGGQEGLNLIATSAYRSYWEQQATFSYWVKAAGLAAAERFSARPGHSQHQLGTAVDFTSESVGKGLTDTFAKVGEGAWLANNAYKFGFVISYPAGKEAITGYTYEPWHYRYIGKDNAAKMIQSGLILEEFLQRFGVV